MSEGHVHAWAPVPGECARYACPCGVVGCRDNSGRIHEVKHVPELDRASSITARPIGDYCTGRVRACIVEDADFWEAQQEL